VGALLDLEPRAAAATPGDRATVKLRVRNTGTVVDQFDLAVLGDSQAWATVDPPTLSLFPGAEGSATVTFSPPRSAQVPAGRLPFAIRAESKEDPAGSIVEEGTVDVAPFSDVFVEIVPRTSRGSRGTTHDLAIDNRGNAAADAKLTATDADRLLSFELRPPALSAPAGTASFAKVAVKPRKTFWRGQSVTRPFQVQVDTGGAAPSIVEGSLLQTPILPPWTVRALVAALAVLVAAVVLWTTLLKPAIESSARQQAADVLAAAGISPLPSGGAGGGGGPSASPGGSGSTGASPSPAASGTSTASASPSIPPIAGGGAPTDGRLLPGGTPLSPPSGTTLFLTDLVFSNPSVTATGDIRLERSGEPLLVLRLENFRELDFHFVTPIVVASGQQLSLVCPGGCPGAALYYSGYGH
jgi:hypothetical protein